MRITAKLAYSQLKINRSRTMWTLLAIALSTALTTAVCSFVASGNAMLVEFLGDDYGEYGHSYVGLLLIPAILLGIIILAMSVVVVSNVFRISAKERIAQFGILKCVGATGKQITATVMYESIFLSAVGIPAGILLGLCLTYAGINVADIYLDDLNALAHIMIREVHFSLDFVLSWQALLISAMVCFVSVLFSAWLPAHKAAKVSAMDSLRGDEAVKLKKKRLRSSHLIEKLFGFEGTLAAKNIRRSRKSFRATVMALSVGVILFICLGALGSQAKAVEDYMQPKAEEDIITEYSSACIRQINKDTGRKESIYMRPIDSRTGNDIAEKLKEFDGKEIFGMGLDLETYYTVLPAESISNRMKAALESSEEPSDELSVEIITLDDENYRMLCKKAGVAAGSNILLNSYSYNDRGKLVDMVPYTSDLKEVELIKANGSSQTLPVQGVLLKEDIPRELIYPSTNYVRLVVQRAQVRGYSWYSDPKDKEGYMEYANEVMAQQFPEKEGSDYMSEGFNTRVYKIDDYMKVMNIAIVLALIFMYSFVILLMLIGFTNVVSTMSTNVMMRSHEFAMLQSVGMTNRGLLRMLNLESILCSLKALLVGLPIGILMTYLINLPIRDMYPIPYEVPWLPALLCTLAVLAITLGTTRWAAYRLRSQNIIETIRWQSGR